jgi:hypothetical protein
MKHPRAPRLPGVVVAVILLVCGAARAQGTGPARSVVLVTMDGLRWQEVFGGAQEKLIDDRAGGVRDVEGLRRRYLRETPEARREALLPFFWSVVGRQGQVFGDPSKNAAARLTNGLKFSYPGYSEMLCGFPDPRIDSNKKVPNPNVTVLEWLNRRPGFEGKVAALGTWDVLYSIVNVERSRVPVLAGWDPSRDEPLGEDEKQVNALIPELPRLWPDNAFDVVTQRLSMEYLRKHRPRVFYVMLGETDEWAHMRRYDCYLDSARRGDDYLRRLWETLQSMPEYAGKTSLLVTTDHGRGQTKKDWTDHGKDVEGAEFVWIGAMGPGVEPLGVRENTEATQSQIAATMAALVGETYRGETGGAAAPLPLRNTSERKPE